MLLHAQPLTRILKLALDDVTDEDGKLNLRLGDPPVPIPLPFAGLLHEHCDQRLNLTTATNRDAHWLFPGRRAGQPMTTDAIELVRLPHLDSLRVPIRWPHPADAERPRSTHRDIDQDQH